MSSTHLYCDKAARQAQAPAAGNRVYGADGPSGDGAAQSVAGHAGIANGRVAADPDLQTGGREGEHRQPAQAAHTAVNQTGKEQEEHGTPLHCARAAAWPKNTYLRICQPLPTAVAPVVDGDGLDAVQPSQVDGQVWR